MNHVASILSNARGNAVSNGVSATAPKKLRALLAGLTDVLPPDVEVTDLGIDSRSVVPGSAFIALPGLRTHGITFAAQVVKAGASVILWEPAGFDSKPAVPAHVALVAIPGLSALVGKIADRFFDAPSQSVRVAGITGTNGKTTTAYVLAAASAALGRASAYAGTLGVGPIDAIKPGTHTTPDAVTLHRQIAALRDSGVTDLGLEVSSHALDQHRVDGLHVDTAVFTNLTRDHLDYHGTLEAYGAAKARLFAWPGLEHAVINVDDAFGRELAAKYRGRGLVVCTRAASAPESLASASYVRARKVVAAAAGLQLDIETHRDAATLRSKFVGDFNVDNILAVLGVLLGWGVPLDEAVRAVEKCVAPPGRMETFTAAGKALAIVDYAHTPDALEKALTAARSHCSGKLVCVFGCGGDRDAGKRPLMGAVAERLADVVIVTDDNPRTEDGDAIISQVLAGMRQPDRAAVQRDRAMAITMALTGAAAGDAVLIAGKGHEDYQIVGLEKRHFSDRAVVVAAMREQRA